MDAKNLIKLDLSYGDTYNQCAMDKVLRSQSIKDAIAGLGWTQKKLAGEIGVTSQAVTNWLKGADFPRPDKLLKLATALKLGFDQLVESQEKKPVIAFRKKAGAKTTEQHLLKAMTMGAMLKPLVSYLPARRTLRTQIPSPSCDYEPLQNAAALVREKLGIGTQAVLLYEHLLSEFQDNDAVIVPVMWGEKQNHQNALHILLPEERVTFIYLNLDTRFEDFKFWMAHELAHVYTPDLAGTEFGEDFADALAGALLFPKELAKIAYAEAANAKSQSAEMDVLRKHAKAHKISLFSVFCEARNYAIASGLPQLRVSDKDIHMVRNSSRGSLVSESLFKPLPPEPSAYVAASNKTFRSAFFHALQLMLHDKGTGAGYVQQVLDISLRDATAIHEELMH